MPVNPDEYKLKDSDLFNGPLNAMSKNVSYIVVPTNEANDSIEEVIKDYTIHIQNLIKDCYKARRASLGSSLLAFCAG